MAGNVARLYPALKSEIGDSVPLRESFIQTPPFFAFCVIVFAR
jgi:hypothetical protein